MACYFPIIYNKTKNDKYYDTKVRLSALLNRAMSSTCNFSEFVLQITLEKLESESVHSKISCYQLLMSALPIYEASHVSPFVNELWTFIRIDTLKPNLTDDELCDYAFATLSKLGDSISTDVSLCDSLRGKIWNDLEISLKSPELSLINAAINVFVSFSSKNHENYKYFFQRSHPILLQSFMFSTENQNKKNCLDGFSSLIKCGCTIGFDFEDSEIIRFYDLLIKNSVKTDFEICKMAINIFQQLSSLRSPSNEQLVLLMEFITDCVESTEFNNQLQYVNLLLEYLFFYLIIISILKEFSFRIVAFALCPFIKDNVRYLHQSTYG